VVNALAECGYTVRVPVFAAFRRIGDQLACAFPDVAEPPAPGLVKASMLSVDHALGSAEPRVTGFRPSLTSVPSHPNATGTRRVPAVHQFVARGCPIACPQVELAPRVRVVSFQ
jgi:hypothetical protein